MKSRSRLAAAAAALALAMGMSVVPAAAGASPSPSNASAATTAVSALAPPAQDPFYRYTGSTPLKQIAPGTVLKTRTVAAHLLGLPLPIEAVQLLYRTTSELGQPMATVTTVLRPPVQTGPAKLISYQSFYDSLTPDCEPSYILAGGIDRGGVVTGETPIMVSFLLQGYTVVTSDFEGQQPAFAAGPQYGMATLDGIRAALHSSATGLNASTPVGMIGYSGGAIATEWATQLAPRYAPNVNKLLVGSAIGGVLVDPVHNLQYVDGSLEWAGVIPMALIGLGRAFDINLTPYLSAYGKQLFNKLQNACFFTNAFAQYPGLTFAELVKPQYAQPESIPTLVRAANKLIMGADGTPTVPLFIRQGTAGELEGTPGDKPGIGAGDGVMIAGDVRSLAREYCARGVRVDYAQFPLSHIPAGVVFMPAATTWLGQRFAGAASPNSCGSIPPGNPLTPIS